MVNGLAVLGWGVGGIEAEAAMLGQPQSMLIPEVIGFKLSGKLNEGVTATDLVLTVTQMLRKKGVVNKFVEFFGPGLNELTLADRATIANMAPEYGATCGFFPVDKETLNYLTISGREEGRVALVEAYCKAQGLFREANSPDPVFTDTLELDLGAVEPSLAGPKRPEGRVALSAVRAGFATALDAEYKKPGEGGKRVAVEGKKFDIGHGDVVIAAITSCTNTSNPSVLIAAGLLARNALAKGLTSKPWVKTSLAPGSQVVAAYLEKSGLQKSLDAIGFNLVGFGCTTCIGNSGPLAAGDLEGHQRQRHRRRGGPLGQPQLRRPRQPRRAGELSRVSAARRRLCARGLGAKDLTKEPLGTGKDGKPVYLKDIWPTSAEIQKFVVENITRDMFKSRYADVFKGDENWQAISSGRGLTYGWDNHSTYVQNPPYFTGITKTPKAVTDIEGARVLASFGDKITTDHISPAGSIKAAIARRQVPDGERRQARRLQPVRHAARQPRGDDARHLRQHPHQEPHGDGREGQRGRGRVHHPSSLGRAHGRSTMPRSATPRSTCRSSSSPASSTATARRATGRRRARTCSASRPWSRSRSSASIARTWSAWASCRSPSSRARPGRHWVSKATRRVSIKGLAAIKPRQKTEIVITRPDGSSFKVPVLCRIDTLDEIDYFRNGGILHFVLRNLAA